MSYEKIWVRYMGNSVPCIQGVDADLCSIVFSPGEWREVRASFLNQFSEKKGWEISDINPMISEEK